MLGRVDGAVGVVEGVAVGFVGCREIGSRGGGLSGGGCAFGIGFRGMDVGG